MEHEELVGITSFDHVGPYTLRLQFDDGGIQTIDFSPILYGNIFGPLRNADFFAQVALDPDFATLVWPNGADFDPSTLRNWPDHLPGFLEAAQRWKQNEAAVQS